MSTVNGTKSQIQGLSASIAGLSAEQAVLAMSTSSKVTPAMMTEALLANKVEKEVAEAAVSHVALSSSQGVATKSTLSLSAAFKGLKATIGTTGLIIGGIATALVAGIAIFNKLHDTAEETAEKVNDLISEFKSLQDEAKQHKDSIDDIADKYEKLADGVDDLGRNVSLTAEEYSEYNTIVNKIADMFPTMVQG